MISPPAFRQQTPNPLRAGQSNLLRSDHHSPLPKGIVGERGVAWRTGDALAIRGFVGISLKERARDHSTVSRTRRLIDGEIYLQVFAWVLGVLADAGLVNGKQIGINATTLEANTALRGIVRQGMKSATRRS